MQAYVDQNAVRSAQNSKFCSLQSFYYTTMCLIISFINNIIIYIHTHKIHTLVVLHLDCSTSMVLFLKKYLHRSINTNTVTLVL